MRHPKQQGEDSVSELDRGCEVMEREMRLQRNMNRPAIYALFKDEKIVYIGQSINAYSRIGNHNKDKDFDYFRIMPCLKRRMNNWEHILIQRYKPRYNKSGLEKKLEKKSGKKSGKRSSRNDIKNFKSDVGQFVRLSDSSGVWDFDGAVLNSTVGKAYGTAYSWNT